MRISDFKILFEFDAMGKLSSIDISSIYQQIKPIDIECIFVLVITFR